MKTLLLALLVRFIVSESYFDPFYGKNVTGYEKLGPNQCKKIWNFTKTIKYPREIELERAVEKYYDDFDVISCWKKEEEEENGFELVLYIRNLTDLESFYCFFDYYFKETDQADKKNPSYSSNNTSKGTDHKKDPRHCFQMYITEVLSSNNRII